MGRVASLLGMPVPQRAPIARVAGYRTDTIGRYRDGQFSAAVHAAHRDDDDAPDWGRERIRWYAFLHLSQADIEAALAVLSAQPSISGADLGRAIGMSPRTGQRLLVALGSRTGGQGETGP